MKWLLFLIVEIIFFSLSLSSAISIWIAARGYQFDSNAMGAAEMRQPTTNDHHQRKYYVNILEGTGIKESEKNIKNHKK